MPPRAYLHTLNSRQDRLPMISSFGELMFRKEFGVVCKANFRKYRGTLICFIPTPVAGLIPDWALGQGRCRGGRGSCGICKTNPPPGEGIRASGLQGLSFRFHLARKGVTVGSAKAQCSIMPLQLLPEKLHSHPNVNQEKQVICQCITLNPTPTLYPVQFFHKAEH